LKEIISFPEESP